MKSRYPVLYFTLLVTVALGLSMTPTEDAPGPLAITPALAAIPADIPILEGTWEGSWTDTLYNVTGNMTIEVSVDGNDYFATGSIDVTQIDASLGTLNGSASGNYDGAVLTGSFDCTSLGSGTASIGGAFKTAGKIQAGGSGSGSVGAPLNFVPFEFTGTVAEGVIWGTFDFTSPTGGEGKAVLTNDALPTVQRNWGSLKSEYRGD